MPGGFGARGTEGKIAASRWARENRIPYLGLCYGLHMAVIDVARNVLGLAGANSTEIDPHTPYPVIDLMPDQKGVEMGGTMRLGLWPCRLLAGHEDRRGLCGAGGLRAPSAPVRGQQLPSAAGWPTPGSSSAAPLQTASWPRSWSCEDHPFFVGVQFHPEFRSRPTNPHPLFRDFIGAAKETLPEGSQRALPLNGTVEAQDEAVLEDRVLAVTHE